AAAGAAGGGVAEAWIEEAGIVDAELADERVEGRHLGGIERRDMHGLARDEDVELVRIEDQLVAATAEQRLPEIVDVVLVLAIDVDVGGVVLAAIADEPVRAGALEVDGKRDAAAGDVRRLAGDERVRGVQRQQLAFAEQGVAAAETDLRQARTA